MNDKIVLGGSLKLKNVKNGTPTTSIRVGGRGGISDAVKVALLDCFQHVAWVDEDGQEYYDALYDALYAQTVVSITAVFEQGQAVIYNDDSLNDLKPFLMVTARYDDGSYAPVTAYILSGTLAPGTSTIQVSYDGKHAHFDVTVTERVLSSISAVYTQSGDVFDTDSLDSLKSDLVVTALYSDASTVIIPSTDYTLSGSLTIGTSTITVSYGGKTTTFNVTVSRNYGTKLYSLYNTTYDGTNSTITAFQLWKEDIDFSIFMDLDPDGNSATEQTVFGSTKPGAPYNGLKFATHGGYYKLFGYYSATPEQGVSNVPTSVSSNIKFVITHEKETSVYNLYSLYSGSISTKTITFNFLANERQLTIGSDSTTGILRPWYGKVNKFEIYNKALTSEEVNQIMGV